MKNNPGGEEIAIVQELLQKDLEFKPVPSHSFEDLKNSLLNYIQHLLNNDLERLVQGLYRIDVSEEKVKEALNNQFPDLIAEQLTTLIIERQQAKAITRKRYRHKN